MPLYIPQESQTKDPVHLSVDLFQGNWILSIDLINSSFKTIVFSRPFINSLLSGPLNSINTIYQVKSFKAICQLTFFKTISFFSLLSRSLHSFNTIYHVNSFKTIWFFQDHLVLSRPFINRVVSRPFVNLLPSGPLALS